MLGYNLFDAHSGVVAVFGGLLRGLSSVRNDDRIHYNEVRKFKFDPNIFHSCKKKCQIKSVLDS